jgi:hypothetical protein
MPEHVNMLGDNLSDVVNVPGAAAVAGGWSICFPQPEKIKFCGIDKGCCWPQTGDEGASVKLQTGDVLLMLRPPVILASG